MLGTRGIWRERWLANTTHPPMESGWGHFDENTWELYHLDVDRNESHSLAAKEPERLEAMKKLWLEEAEKYDGMPLDDRSVPEILASLKENPTPTLMPETDKQFFYRGRPRSPSAPPFSTSAAPSRSSPTSI